MAKKGGAPTKSEVLTTISKDTGLSRKQVSGVFDSLGGVIKKSLRGNGLFTMPGLLKMKVVKKPATASSFSSGAGERRCAKERTASGGTTSSASPCTMSHGHAGASTSVTGTIEMPGATVMRR